MENLQEILSMVDHTLLRQTATWEEIRRVCEEGLEFRTASVCIPPCYVKEAHEFLGGRLPVCTVIGFPNGSSTTACHRVRRRLYQDLYGIFRQRGYPGGHRPL